MQKRASKSRKCKNFILKTITWIAGIMAVLSACAIDSPSMIPAVVLVVCLAWLGLVGYANGVIEL